MEKINRVGCLRVIKLGTSRNPPVLLLLHCIDLIPFDDGIILIQPAAVSSAAASPRLLSRTQVSAPPGSISNGLRVEIPLNDRC